MNPETQAWLQLHDRAASRLSPDFADRALRAGREAAAAALSPRGQFTLSVAMAAACLLAVALLQIRGASDDDGGNLNDWQRITSASDDAGFAQ